MTRQSVCHDDQFDLERLADARQRPASEPGCQANQPQKHLRGDERVAAGRVAIVRNDAEHLAQGIEREMPDRRAPGERAVALEVQREIHRVEASVHELEAPVPAVGGIEGRDVVADVMTDDHAVTQIVEEQLERLRFVHPLPALVARDAVDGHGFGVALHLDQSAERILEDDLTVDHRDRADRDDAVRRRSSARWFRNRARRSARDRSACRRSRSASKRAR